MGSTRTEQRDPPGNVSGEVDLVSMLPQLGGQLKAEGNSSPSCSCCCLDASILCFMTVLCLFYLKMDCLLGGAVKQIKSRFK